MFPGSAKIGIRKTLRGRTPNMGFFPLRPTPQSWTNLKIYPHKAQSPDCADRKPETLLVESLHSILNPVVFWIAFTGAAEMENNVLNDFGFIAHHTFFGADVDD